MKKVKVFLGIAVVAIIGTSFFYGCQKDQKNTNSLDKLNQKSLYEDNLFVKNPYPIEKYLFNPEDPDEENLDRQLYEIGLIAKHLFKDTKLNQYIIENASQHANDCIDLRTFPQWIEVSKGYYSPKIINELQSILDKTKLQYVSKNHEFHGKVEHYIPAIFVANIEKADPEKMPIFSSGVFVNEELPGMEKYEDNIVVWYFDPAINDFVEGLMSEKMALATTHPIFIVDNANEEMTNRKKNDGNNGSGSNNPCEDHNITPEMRSDYYCSNEYQLNVRHEKNGKTEFCVTSRHIDEHGNAFWVLTPDTWYLIAKVPKKDIGKQLSRWTDFWRPVSVVGDNVVPFKCNYIFWNTFERDWAKSPKPLGEATANGHTIRLEGRMKSESNWYAYHPDDVKNHPLDLDFIFWNWAKSHDNSNGKFRIWRVQK